ncbi:hypothetical protein F5880DRAFT_1097234 [Lentinula raphanica]|nr:hypothetical protein F5880DRAFT_1097234 [Lentinula raphanica]
MIFLSPDEIGGNVSVKRGGRKSCVRRREYQCVEFHRRVSVSTENELSRWMYRQSVSVAKIVLDQEFEMVGYDRSICGIKKSLDRRGPTRREREENIPMLGAGIETCSDSFEHPKFVDMIPELRDPRPKDGVGGIQLQFVSGRDGIKNPASVLYDGKESDSQPRSLPVSTAEPLCRCSPGRVLSDHPVPAIYTAREGERQAMRTNSIGTIRPSSSRTHRGIVEGERGQ